MEENVTGGTPPYVSYKTFKGLLEHFAEGGVPGKFDRTFWGTKYNGAVGTTLRGALAFFGMIDANDHLSPAVQVVSTSDENEFKAHMSRMIKESYKPLFEGGFDLQRATTGQLREKFESVYGTKSTTEKAVTFFLHAAKDVEIGLSPFFRTRQKRRSRRANTSAPNRAKALRDDPPITPPDTRRVELGAAASSGLIVEAFKRLPKPGEVFSTEDRKKWMSLIQSAFEIEYEST